MVAIEKISGFDPGRFTFLIYGESGVGKTRFASTFPDPIFVDADNGMASVTREVARIPVASWDDIRQAFALIKKEVEAGRFKTVVIDTLNEVQAIALRSIIQQYPGISRPYGSLASESDYGKMLFDFEAFLRAVQQLPCISVFIAQSAPKQYATDVVLPGLIGKNTARNVARMVDIIGYMYREDEEVTIGFNLNDYVSKDRSGKLPSKIVRPTWDAIAKYLDSNGG
jgi:hypothetical protein